MVALAVSFVSVYVFSVNEVLSNPTYLCAKRNDGPFKIFEIDLFYFMYMNVLHTCICVCPIHMPVAHGVQKGTSDFLELEL